MLTLVSFYDNLSPLLACSYSHFISWVLSQLQIVNHPYFSDVDGMEASVSYITYACMLVWIETNCSDVSTDHHGAPFTTELNLLMGIEVETELW